MSEENEKYANYIFDWMREVYKAWEEKKNIKRPFTEKSSNSENYENCTRCFFY